MKKKTDSRRQAILEAAKVVFEEVGFEQATMSEISARVGGSKATLYRYFDSKEALFLELVRTSATQLSGQMLSLFDPCIAVSVKPSLLTKATETKPLLNPEEDVSTVLTGLGERILEIFYTRQRMATKRMVIAVASNPEIGKLFYENGPAKGLKYIETYIDSVMKEGKLRQADPRVMAAHFRGLLDSEIYEPSLFNAIPELDASQITAIVKRAVTVFMTAYGPNTEALT